MSILGDEWFEVIPDKMHKVKKPKSLEALMSVYKRSKIAVHTTVNGRGKVSRLFKK